MLNINISWQASDQKLRKKIHAKTHKIYDSRNEIDAYYFHQSWTCENITKQPKTYQEHTVIFQEFCKNFLACIGVQITRIKGVYSKKNPKNARKLQAQSFTAQTHGSDGSGSSSGLREHGPGLGSTRPSAHIKREKTRFHSFLSFSSPSLLRRFPFLQTLALTSSNPPRIRSSMA